MEALNPAQLKEANSLDKMLRRLINFKEELKHYKLDDVYVLEEWDRYNPKKVSVQMTHMGFPVKYKVVYISPEGIPHLRKLTSTGKASGESFLPPEAATINVLRRLSIDEVMCQKFVPDPEQLDSILLQTEFDPMAQHRIKTKLFTEINKHNKRVTVPTDFYSFNKIGKFFKSSQPGDKFWTAVDMQYVIQSVIKQGREWVITATDMNQATKTFNISSFKHKRLYKEQPRSFSKESKI